MKGLGLDMRTFRTAAAAFASRVYGLLNDLVINGHLRSLIAVDLGPVFGMRMPNTALSPCDLLSIPSRGISATPAKQWNHRLTSALDTVGLLMMRGLALAQLDSASKCTSPILKIWADERKPSDMGYSSLAARKVEFAVR